MVRGLGLKLARFWIGLCLWAPKEVLTRTVLMGRHMAEDWGCMNVRV